MNTRVSSSLLLLVAIVSASSCERPDQPPATNDAPITPGLTPNEDADAGQQDLVDAGETDAGLLDAGSVDAGVEDAGPVCPPLTRPAAGGCESEVSLRLTGTAAAIRGDTLYAGMGQQPVLEVFYRGPAGVGPDEVSITLGRSLAESGDAGGGQTHAIASATTDDAGTHYDLPWPTTGLPEGTYQARATVTLGAAEFTSNTVGLLVDRTPPAVDLNLSFDSDAQVQPRDFRATATVAAADDGGSGEVTIALFGTGVTLLPAGKEISLREATKVALPAGLPLVEGNLTTLETTLYGGDISYDAWSTKENDWPIEIEATATDLVGNTATAKVTVPVTREIWANATINTAGPLSIGLQGQILVNHGFRLDALLPDGSLQSSTKIAAAQGGDPSDATGAPETLVSRKAPQGQTFVSSLVYRPPFLYGQVASVGSSDSFATITSNGVMALAVSVSHGLLYALSGDCSLRTFDPMTGANDTPAGTVNPFPASCSNARVALGKNHLIASGANFDLSYVLSPLEGEWSSQVLGTQGAPPVFLGGLAVFDVGGNLELFDPSTGPDNDWMAVGSATATKVVTSSQGDVFVLDAAAVLTKLSSKGTTTWQRKLEAGVTAPGLALGVGAKLIYAVDGTGTLSVFDAAGNLRWKSPQKLVQGDLLIDRCTAHAYASTLAVPMAVAVDSFGLDLASGSWPVAGHDAFQTYDAEGTADVDCSNHL